MGLRQQLRIEKIRTMLPKGKSWQEIAEACNVTRMTIWRDFNSWRKSEDFKTWLYSEYVTLVGQVKGSDPDKALREITKIIIKDMTEKIEHKGSVGIVIKRFNLHGDEADESTGL